MFSVYAKNFTNGFVYLVGAAHNRKYYISCIYRPGDRVRYKWTNNELRTGIVTHIDCFVNVKNCH